MTENPNQTQSNHEPSTKIYDAIMNVSVEKEKKQIEINEHFRKLNEESFKLMGIDVPQPEKPIVRDLLDPSIRVKDLTSEEIRERIIQFMGVEPPGFDEDDGACTYFVLVAIVSPKAREDKLRRKDGTESLLVMPEQTADRMVFSSCTGMVVGMGPDAYVDPNRFPHGPSCKLGDWVVIPRHEGVQIRYRGVAMHWLPDDKVAMRIKDPSYVVRG